MRIKYGSTRFVILKGDKAIKVGKVRIWRFLARIIILPFSIKQQKHFLERYGPGFWTAVKNDICIGLRANRYEYEYYKKYSDLRVMPTIKSLLLGWIIIQPRGNPINSTAEFIKGRPPIKEKINGESSEVTEVKQFCQHPVNKKIVLIDYGKKETIQALMITPT